MRWPWSKPKVETRAADGFTALSMLARAETITSRRGVAEAVAASQACIALWQNSLSRADVTGDGGLLTAPLLALAGRSLATRGEAVFVLDGERLAPVSDFDLNTTMGRPRVYRCSLPEAGGGETRTYLAAEVLHFRINASEREPWRGRSPLSLAPITAEMLAVVETALGEVFGNAPLGSQVCPMPELPREDQDRLAGSFRSARGRVLLRESVTTSAAGGPAPMVDWRPSDLTPSLKDSMVIESWDRARDSICQVFGVDPSLLSSIASGPGLREAQRHLVTYHLQPVAGLIAAEASEKLGQPVTLDLVTPLGAVDHGGRARAAAQLIGAMASAKAAGLTEAEVAAAFDFVGLHDLIEG